VKTLACLIEPSLRGERTFLVERTSSSRERTFFDFVDTFFDFVDQTLLSFSFFFLLLHLSCHSTRTTENNAVGVQQEEEQEQAGDVAAKRAIGQQMVARTERTQMDGSGPKIPRPRKAKGIKRKDGVREIAQKVISLEANVDLGQTGEARLEEEAPRMPEAPPEALSPSANAVEETEQGNPWKEGRRILGIPQSGKSDRVARLVSGALARRKPGNQLTDSYNRSEIVELAFQ
jgi:hypothetical protein